MERKPTDNKLAIALNITEGMGSECAGLTLLLEVRTAANSVCMEVKVRVDPGVRGITTTSGTNHDR